jgi:hypothetical protein
VRKPLRDLYRGYGEAFWRARNEQNVGNAVAPAFKVYARDNALGHTVIEQSAGRLRLRRDSMPHARLCRPCAATRCAAWR